MSFHTLQRQDLNCEYLHRCTSRIVFGRSFLQHVLNSADNAMQNDWDRKLRRLYVYRAVRSAHCLFNASLSSLK